MSKGAVKRIALTNCRLVQVRDAYRDCAREFLKSARIGPRGLENVVCEYEVEAIHQTGYKLGFGPDEFLKVTDQRYKKILSNPAQGEIQHARRKKEIESDLMIASSMNPIELYCKRIQHQSRIKELEFLKPDEMSPPTNLTPLSKERLAVEPFINPIGRFLLDQIDLRTQRVFGFMLKFYFNHFGYSTLAEFQADLEIEETSIPGRLRTLSTELLGCRATLIQMANRLLEGSTDKMSLEAFNEEVGKRFSALVSDERLALLDEALKFLDRDSPFSTEICNPRSLIVSYLADLLGFPYIAVPFVTRLIEATSQEKSQ